MNGTSNSRVRQEGGIVVSVSFGGCITFTQTVVHTGIAEQAWTTLSFYASLNWTETIEKK